MRAKRGSGLRTGSRVRLKRRVVAVDLETDSLDKPRREYGSARLSGVLTIMKPVYVPLGSAYRRGHFAGVNGAPDRKNG